MEILSKILEICMDELYVGLVRRFKCPLGQQLRSTIRLHGPANEIKVIGLAYCCLYAMVNHSIHNNNNNNVFI